MHTWRIRCLRLLQSHSRLDWLFLLTAGGLLAGILLSLPAWSGVRSYPLVPIFSPLTLSPLWHSGLVIGLIISLLASLRSRAYRPLSIGVTLSCLAALSLLDIARFQPWVFHYFAILFLFTLPLRTPSTATRALDAARIAIGGIYFWSGLQKINVTFFSDTFPWFTQPLWEHGPTWLLTGFLALGLLVPFLEIALPIGLFFRRTRTLALVGSGSMMLLVLMCLGPLGHNWNSIVWPWNIVLFLTAITLFWQTDWSARAFLERQKTNLLGLSMFALFWLLPLGSFWGQVDHYLAWSLYSGRVPEAVLMGDPMILQALSPYSQGDTLKFTHWSLYELNQAPYPEERVFQAVFTQVCDQYQNDPSLQLRITQPQSFRSTAKTLVVTECSKE